MHFLAHKIAALLLIMMSTAVWSYSQVLPDTLLVTQPSMVIHHPNPRLLDGFGMSLSQGHGQILVGAPNALNQGREVGASYLFDMQGRLLHSLEIPDRISGALFGQTVALSSQSIIIGAPHGRDALQTQTGAVYVFDRHTRTYRLTLKNPLPTSGVFGHTVAVGQDRVLVGDPQASSATSFRTGAVYIFHEKSGVLKQTIRPVTKKGSRPTQFGHAISLVGSHVFVAAPFGGTAGSDAGIVYVFDMQTGNLIRSFEPPKEMPLSFFGWSFAANRDSIVIGAFGFQGTYREEGIVFMYDVHTGKLLQTIANPSPTERARFGKSVALSSTSLVVSAPGDRIQTTGRIEGGRVYVFHPNTGKLRVTLQESLRMTGASDVFGNSLFIGEEALLIGAPFDGIGAELDAGLVYQYRWKETP